MMKPSELQALALASRQSGYLTRRQAIALGMSDAMLQARVAAGGWRRVKPGLFMVLGTVTTPRGILTAASAALGAVVSHESAAEIHGFPNLPTGRLVVTVPVRTTNRFPDVVVHQSTDLTAGFVTSIDDLPVTTAGRTIIDLAPTLGRKRLGRMVDWAAMRGLVDLEVLRADFEGLARHGKPGVSRLRPVLEDRLPDYVPTESELEAAAVEAIASWALPAPLRQYPLPWRSSRRGRVDLAYPDHRVLIEVDGRVWHSLLDAFDEDRMRDNLAQIAGWRVIRITFRMLRDRQWEVRQTVAAALGAESEGAALVRVAAS